MHGGEQAPGGIKRETLTVAQSGGVAFLRREMLILFVRIIEPSAGAGLQLNTRLVARRIGNAIFFLAGIGRRAEIDEQVAFRIDDERVHRMITSKRQAGNNDV